MSQREVAAALHGVEGHLHYSSPLRFVTHRSLIPHPVGTVIPKSIFEQTIIVMLKEELVMSHRSSNPLASAYSFIHFWIVVYEGKRCWLVSVRPKDVSVDSGRSGSVGTGEGEDEEQGDDEEEEEEEEGEGEEEEVEKREWLKITSSSSSSTRHTAEYMLLKNVKAMFCTQCIEEVHRVKG